jgi:hypothetical protein
MLPSESNYVKQIKGLEIMCGKFNWYGDVMARPDEPGVVPPQDDQI